MSSSHSQPFQHHQSHQVKQTPMYHQGTHMYSFGLRLYHVDLGASLERSQHQTAKNIRTSSLNYKIRRSYKKKESVSKIIIRMNCHITFIQLQHLVFLEARYRDSCRTHILKLILSLGNVYFQFDYQSTKVSKYFGYLTLLDKAGVKLIHKKKSVTSKWRASWDHPTSKGQSSELQTEYRIYIPIFLLK